MVFFFKESWTDGGVVLMSSAGGGKSKVGVRRPSDANVSGQIVNNVFFSTST